MTIFESLGNRLQDIFKELRRQGKLSEAAVDAAMREIRLSLLEADVHYSVVKSFVQRVRERSIGVEVAKSLTPGQQVVKIVYQELIATLGQPVCLDLRGNTPHRIVLVGLQGSGKTTTVAKLALHLRREGHSPLMVAADIYRPAAIEQLHVLGRQINIPVYIEEPGSSPPTIVYNGLQAAIRENASVVIVDTAGRLQIDQQMMDELAAINSRIGPQETLLVADAMTGQEAVNIAQGFNNYVALTGLILTKVDGDARGGAAISMREVTGVPIKFLGTSEKLDGLEIFHPERLAGRILGMGDVLTLIEKAEALSIDETESLELEKKMRTASFTLEDFRKQLQQIKKMGPITHLLEMIPGVNQTINQLPPEDMDRQLKRVEAIINSMTLTERQHPKLLNASRRKRIAAGSGSTVQEVNQLMKQFQQMQHTMQTLMKQRGPLDPRKLFRQ